MLDKSLGIWYTIYNNTRGHPEQQKERNDMKGTEKQIKWAEDIKAEAIANLDNLINYAKRMESFGDMMKSATNYYTSEAAEIVKQYILNAFEKIDDAKYYIDNRAKLTYNAFERVAADETRHGMIAKMLNK